jgi:pimeloyl-ACP methyl ester carboxylesterase
MMTTKHEFIETNGIRMHYATRGTGPLVVLCHGFPETWNVWRHQLRALEQAGFQAVAPDMRGCGQTDCPQAISEYNIFQLTGDIVGLVQALDAEQAVVVGHDWGAPMAAHCALLRPDIFTAVVLLSVPYTPRAAAPPTEVMKHLAGDKEFYQLYFQEPGKAEVELEADVRDSLARMLYSASGDAPAADRWRFLFEKHERLMDTVALPARLPGWLTELDLNFAADEYSRTGFRGGLNWYRNLDYNWSQTAFLTDARIEQPSLFIAGDQDGSVAFRREHFDKLESTMPGLTRKVLLPGIGHWTPEESPNEVSRLMIEFLKDLPWTRD